MDGTRERQSKRRSSGREEIGAAAGGGRREGVWVVVAADWKQDLEVTGRVGEESLGLGKQDLMSQEKWRLELELELLL